MRKASRIKARETIQTTNGISPFMFSNSSCLYLTDKGCILSLPSSSKEHYRATKNEIGKRKEKKLICKNNDGWWVARVL